MPETDALRDWLADNADSPYLDDLRTLVAQAVVDASKRQQRRAKLVEFVGDIAYGLGFFFAGVAVWLAFGVGVTFVFIAAGFTVYYIGNRVSHPRWHRFVQRSRVAAYLLGHRDER